MIILHVANLSDKKSAGPNINVPQNVIYGNKYATVGLYNLKKSNIAVELPRDRYFSITDYPTIESLPSPFDKPDIVIFQGMYEIEQCGVAKKIHKKNIPYIIVPRCSLTTEGQRKKRIKKIIGNILFFNKFIKNASCIQFLTENEYQESKNNFKFRDFFILGNGVEMPKKKYVVKKRKEFKIVFIGRLNVYHKGLDLLLQTVSDNIQWFRDNMVTVNLYGSNSDNGVFTIRKYIDENNIKDIVKLNGPVFDEEKESILLDSDVFIHTSRLEGQPTAVIEAISYGIPVIVTPGTNIVDVVNANDLGYSCEFSKESIFDCIKKSISDKNNYKIISANEIQYAKANFNWDSIIKKFIVNIKR